MLSAHVGVMSAAAFGDLPTVTTVGRSVGIFPQNNDFCSKCWCPKMKSILETSRILRKPASINSDPRSHCQLSSWMTWADCRVVSYNLFDHVDSNFRTIICFHIGWQGTSVYLSNDTDNPDLTISSATQNSLNENTYRAKSFSQSLLISQLIFSWVVNDNIVSVIKFVCLFQFWMTLCQAHSVPIQWKPSYLSFFCGQNFRSVATTVHLLLSSLAVQNLSLKCLSNKHPLINQCLLSNQDWCINFD